MSQRPGNRTQRRNRWLVPAVVIAIAAVLIATVVVANQDGGSPGSDPANAAGSDAPTQGPVAPESTQPDLTAVETRQESDPLAVGPVDAPVGLVVFSDYQCPYCATWSKDTLPAMMEHVEAGDLRIEWRDMTVFGPASERASRAAYAAALQGRFLDYHHALFENGENRSEEELADETLIALAGDLGLDTGTFTADYNSPETAQVVADNATIAPSLGAYSTPAFILGGQPVMGAQPTETFEQLFQQTLTGAQ